MFTDIYYECIPEKTVKENFNPAKPWLTFGLLNSIRNKNKLYKDSVKTPSPLRESIYKDKRNRLNRLVKAAKKSYYSKQFENNKNDLKKSWTIIKEVINKRKIVSDLPSKFRYNNKVIEDNLSISNRFNE